MAPGAPEGQERVDPVLTPPYPAPFEAWWDEPCAGTRHPPPAHGHAEMRMFGLVEVLPVALQIRRDRPPGVPCRRGPPRDVSGVRQSGQDPGRGARPQTVSGPATPPARLGGASIAPGSGPLPPGRHRVGAVQEARGIGRQALGQQTPPPAGPLPEPDDLGRAPEALAHGGEPPTRPAGSDGLPDRPPTALTPPDDDLPGPRAMLAPARPHAHCALGPSRLARALAARRAHRAPPPIGPQEHGSPPTVGCPRLGRRPCAARRRIQGARARRQGPGASRGRTRHHDGPRTAPGLECPAATLRRRPPSRLLARDDRRGSAPLWTPFPPPPPPARSTPAPARALGHARAPTRRPPRRAGGPRRGATGSCGQHVCDDGACQDTGPLPRGEDPRGERDRVFNRAHKLSHSRILMTDAVGKASPREAASCGHLGEGGPKRPAFALLCQPSPN